MDSSELKKRIDRLKQIELAKKNWDVIARERDKTEQALELAKEEWHTLLIKKEKNQPIPNITEKEACLRDLKQKKKELDTLLDELEEQSEEQTAHQLKEIAALILKDYPKEEAFYLELQGALAKALHLENEAYILKQLIHDLVLYPDKITEIRHYVKRKGFFSYIFGPNPNGMISLHLSGLKKDLEIALPQVEILAAETKGGDDLRLVYAEIVQFFSGLKTECEEQWSYKKIDIMMTRAKSKFDELDRFFTELHYMQKEKHQKIELKLKEWMEQFAK